jgi:argininosuccinate synthase
MRIVLAYSGSLKGSAAIPWIRDVRGAEVVTVTLDLGQGRELEAVRDRALALGALRAHVLDTRELFAQEFVLPALRADALHAGQVPMALALSRPLVAQKLVEIARVERADAVAHTGGAGAASALDRLLQSLAPEVTVVRPAREWTLDAEALAAFARAHGLNSAGDPSRIESNFWGRSVRVTGAGAQAAFPSASVDGCPDEPAIVDISFSRGVPTALNGVALPLIELVGSLGTLAARHGVGRASSDVLLCDAPAAVLLHAAHRALTLAASDEELERVSASARAAFVGLAEDGGWFSPLREALDAYFAVAQAGVNGHVRLQLLKGQHSISTTELSKPNAASPVLRLVPSQAQH